MANSKKKEDKGQSAYDEYIKSAFDNWADFDLNTSLNKPKTDNTSNKPKPANKKIVINGETHIMNYSIVPYHEKIIDSNNVRGYDVGFLLDQRILHSKLIEEFTKPLWKKELVEHTKHLSRPYEYTIYEKNGDLVFDYLFQSQGSISANIWKTLTLKIKPDLEDETWTFELILHTAFQDDSETYRNRVLEDVPLVIRGQDELIDALDSLDGWVGPNNDTERKTLDVSIKGLNEIDETELVNTALNGGVNLMRTFRELESRRTDASDPKEVQKSVERVIRRYVTIKILESRIKHCDHIKWNSSHDRPLYIIPRNTGTWKVDPKKAK